MNDEPREISADEPEEAEEYKQLRKFSAEELKEIVAAHESWLNTSGKEGAKADLSRADLRDADLSGAILMQVDFSGATLTQADLSEANLSEANLERVHLDNADLGGSHFFKADLNGASLSGANLRGANLHSADLSGANLSGANLREANLNGTNLNGTNFRGAILSEANLGEANLHGANLSGVDLSDADFRQADLRHADLSEADLAGAKLGRAKLFEADLRGAVLYGAGLGEADLSCANLRGANLRGANLEKADLTDADFRNADLSDARLSDVTGLLAENLSGADLSNAKLPEDISRFEGLAHVAEISKHARNIFLAVIAGCVYSWLTIATTTDAALITNSATSPLPIIQAKVPIAGFYWAGAPFLLSLYFYLHFYLQSLWEGLGGLPARFPDGRWLDQRAYPWLLTCLVRAHMPLLKENPPAFSKLKLYFSVTTAWLLVPATLVFYWLRYLPRHDWIGTTILVFALTVSIAAGVAFHHRARATLRGDNAGDGPKIRNPVVMAGSLASLAAIAFSGMTIFGSYPNLVVRAEMPEVELSQKPADWKGGATGDALKAQMDRVKGARLAGANLRFANVRFAFLAEADLIDADLTGADLIGADLRGADLYRADLSGAFLRGANLSGAYLRAADLRGADLRAADVTGAFLRYAKNLTQAQLDQACGDKDTKPPLGLTVNLCPKSGKGKGVR